MNFKMKSIFKNNYYPTFKYIFKFFKKLYFFGIILN